MSGSRFADILHLTVLFNHDPVDGGPATRSVYPARPGARPANRLAVNCLAANRLTARGVVRAVLVFVATLVAAGCQTTPTPVEELVTEPRGREAMALAQRASEPDESDPAKASRGTASAPSVLVLGSVHLAQADYGYTETSFEQVRESLSAYEPDMVVVEQLPSDWPVGKGRDYRPGFALAQYAQR